MIQGAKVLRVSLDGGLRPIEVEDRYQRVVLVVMHRGAFLGQVTLAARRTLTVERQWSAIGDQLHDVLWRQWVRTAFTRAALGSPDKRPRPSRPSVSVIVCTRDRPQDLRVCLESIGRLRTPPAETIVVDNCPSDDATRRLCEDYPVRYLLEPTPGVSRAKNRAVLEARGEVIASVDDDCIVDPHWLDGLGDPFDDPLVMALTGYAGPLELETRAQYLFEAHGGLQRFQERLVFDGASGSPLQIGDTAGAGANSFYRRRVFDEIGLFPEDLGPGTPVLGEEKYVFYRIAEAGYRIVFDPSRIVWHRHRRDDETLRRTLFSYTVGEFGYTTRCLLERWEPGVLHIWRWWPRHLCADLVRLGRGDDRAIPLNLILAEAAGIPLGPWMLWRSRRSRRGVPPLKPSSSLSHPRAESTGGAVRVRRPEAPPLSVAIPSRNRRERLRQVLTALAAQEYPAERWEAVVVLDGSTDGSDEMVRALDVPFRIKLLEQDNRGVAAARNRGAHEASHPIVVFLDDDIVPERAFLHEHAAAHARREPHVALGYYPPLIAQPGLWPYAVRAWWEDHFRRKADPDHRWTYIDFSDGNSSLPRALLFDSGGYDEDFRGRRQDWELGIRMLRRGVEFAYYPDAKGLHHLDTSYATALRNARQEARDDVLLGSKHPHVRGQLPLGGEVSEEDPGTASRLLSLAYRRRAAVERALGPAAAAVQGLERLRLRGRWWVYAHELLRLSYALGVTDALPTTKRFEEFFAPVWDGEAVESVPVCLDAPGTLALSPGAGTVELRLRYRDVPVARTRATPVGGQWDWHEVTERVVRAASWRARQAPLLEALTGTDHEPPAPAPAGHHGGAAPRSR